MRRGELESVSSSDVVNTEAVNSENFEVWNRRTKSALHRCIYNVSASVSPPPTLVLKYTLSLCQSYSNMSGYKIFAVVGAGNIGTPITEELLNAKSTGTVDKVVILSRPVSAQLHIQAAPTLTLPSSTVICIQAGRLPCARCDNCPRLRLFLCPGRFHGP